MPAEGNKFTKDKNLPVVGKILSRKQRKRLEQIVEKKNKKESRAELLAALKSVQTDSLQGLESLSSVQTKGVKKQLVESKENLVLVKTDEISENGVLDTLARKRKRHKAPKVKVKAARRSDVIGFESSSSEEDEEDEEEQEEQGDEEEDGDTQEVLEPSMEQSDDKDEEDKDIPVERVDPKSRDEEEVKEVEATSHKPSNLKTVTVSRAAGLEEGRSKLPILGQEQEIMELINNHGVVVLSGKLERCPYQYSIH